MKVGKKHWREKDREVARARESVSVRANTENIQAPENLEKKTTTDKRKKETRQKITEKVTSSLPHSSTFLIDHM